jgi:pimeloyl-ACP methyl ester carboxylesterase
VVFGGKQKIFYSKFKKRKEVKIMKNSLSIKRIILYVVTIVLVSIVVIGLLPGKTEPITDENGNKIEGSLSKMEEINLGGAKQWIVIRGESKENPIILLLSGGPGGSEMGRFLKFNKELEKHFIVVNWEQRGSGKSYSAIKNRNDMTVDQYVSDINELTNYLKDKYNKEKIYLLGHSWGTIIGTKAVQKYPEQFHAYIGAAQMVDIESTDKYIYDFMLKNAEKNGETKMVETLKENGGPPYNGENVLEKYRPILTNYAQYYRKENPYHEKDSQWYNPLSILWIPEYNIVDKINVFRGMINTFNIMYPQIQDVNFIEQATKFEVPVYYFIGKYDYTAKFIDEYYNIIEAPHKALYMFEESHHGEIWSEADKFHQIMVDDILKK